MASKLQQLRQRFLVTGAAVALGLVIILAILTGNSATVVLRQQADDRGRDVASRVAALVSQYLRERRHEAEALAASPLVVRAALAASQQPGQQADPELRAYFRDYTQRSDFAELFFTESRGLTVLSSGRAPGVAHGDEEWWQRAVATGGFEGEPSYDSVAAAVSMEYDVAIRAPQAPRPVGVLKAVFGLDRLGRLLGTADLGSGAYLEVVDEHAHIVVAPDPSQLLHTLPDAQAVPRVERPAAAVVPAASGDQLVTTVPANNGKWWVIFRQPTATAYAAARTTQRTIWIGALALFLVTVGVLTMLGGWLNKRVTEPVRAAGAIASRVAGGDLSVTVVSRRTEAAEVEDLLSSVHAMVVALRRLVGAIRSAAEEAAAMAAEISASTEEMSASTEQMSATCQDLSRRAAEQAQLVRAAADDAGRILQIVAALANGAQEAAQRNTDLAALARHHKELLDHSTAQLAKLAEEVARGAEEADALAGASAEIQRFVTQAKAVATQTNMLALNAAIEAARAGPQGRGFAVVADEVRKLASVAAHAAGETADTVRGVLGRVQATRDRLARLAQGGAAARQAVQSVAQGLATVAGEAEANDSWSREIAKSAAAARALVEEIAARLTTVAQGTDNLLAAAQQIAASSEEQSASTQEIASSANQLAEAADRLTGAVKSFRLLADEPLPAHQAAD